MFHSLNPDVQKENLSLRFLSSLCQSLQTRLQKEKFHRSSQFLGEVFSVKNSLFVSLFFICSSAGTQSGNTRCFQARGTFSYFLFTPSEMWTIVVLMTHYKRQQEEQDTNHTVNRNPPGQTCPATKHRARLRL